MKNLFRRPQATNSGIEDNVRQLLSPLAGQCPSPEAANSARRALHADISAPTPVRGLGFARRLALGSAAVFAPLMAVTAVGALTGQEQLSAPLGFVSSAAGQLGVGGNSGDHRQDAEHRDAAAGENGQPGWIPPAGNGGSSTLAATNATPSTSPAAGGSQTSQGASGAAHTNGKGCDDVNTAVISKTPTPGGPQGCDVGSSGEHRKNGQNKSQTGQNSTSSTNQTPEPHANGQGCDDVNEAVATHTGTPGGPQGCDVGSSGEHRKNGQNGQGGPAAPSSTAAAGPSQAAGPSKGAGNQGNGSSGGQGSGNQGNGKGPKK